MSFNIIFYDTPKEKKIAKIGLLIIEVIRYKLQQKKEDLSILEELIISFEEKRWDWEHVLKNKNLSCSVLKTLESVINSSFFAYEESMRYRKILNNNPKMTRTDPCNIITRSDMSKDPRISLDFLINMKYPWRTIILNPNCTLDAVLNIVDDIKIPDGKSAQYVAKNRPLYQLSSIVRESSIDTFGGVDTVNWNVISAHSNISPSDLIKVRDDVYIPYTTYGISSNPNLTVEFILNAVSIYGKKIEWRFDALSENTFDSNEHSIAYKKKIKSKLKSSLNDLPDVLTDIMNTYI